MAFEGLQEKLREQVADLTAKIQESSAFNSLRETYESQTPVVQKALLVGGCLFFVLIMLSFPMGYISTSNDNMVIFEENRQLIQGLLRASRAAKEPSPLPADGSTETLRAQVTSITKEFQLVPEQVGEMQPLPEGYVRDLAPPVVKQSGLAVQLKNLNLNQIVALNVAFQNIGLGTKLIGLDVIQSAGQTHYYDIVARIVMFSLPQMTFEAGPSDTGSRSRPRAPPSRAEDDEGLE